MPTPLYMAGAAGRMGQTIAGLALADPERYTLRGGYDRDSGSFAQLGDAGAQVPIAAELPQENGAVIIDFTHASVTPGIIAHCRQHRMPLVIGTTGIERHTLEEMLTEAGQDIPILAAPNMSVGVNVVFAMAAKIAQALGEDYDIEIVEAHHHHKVDAPSGTAFGIADAIADATGRTRADYEYGREGHTGAREQGKIGVHALRMGDVVGDHTAWFVGNGERVTLGHQAHDRSIFARGALRAAAFLHQQTPGVYRMADVLGIA